MKYFVMAIIGIIWRDIKTFIRKCVRCSVHKLGKKIKPNNMQIISHFALERIELDIIIYLFKLYPNNKSDFKYLLCIVDHFSKFEKHI